MSMCSSHHERAARHHRGRRLRRFGNREEWLTKLEEYQRDLEQELADIADIIRRLKEESGPQTASV
jgi:hypothetical protein